MSLVTKLCETLSLFGCDNVFVPVRVIYPVCSRCKETRKSNFLNYGSGDHLLSAHENFACAYRLKDC